MTPVEFVEIFTVSVFAGVFGALLGLGGGIILVPALITIFNVPRQVAVAASVVSVIATSSAAAIAYVRDHYTDMRLGLRLEVSTSLGAIVGAALAGRLSDELVAGMFAVLLVYAAISIVRKPPERSDLADVPPTESALVGSYYDTRLNRDVTYTVRRMPEGLCAGFFAGNLSAILGVGGGIVKVPVMVTRMGVPMKVATATSNFMIGVTALATAIPYYVSGHINPCMAGPCALGVLVGARTGAKLAQKLRSRYLRVVFAGVLLYTAWTMAVRAGLPAMVWR